MARSAFLFLSLALVASVALPAAADKAFDRSALNELAGGSCSLSEAVENALAALTGTAAKARLKRSRKPGQEPIWFYKVAVFDEESERGVVRFDAWTCESVEPAEPQIDMSDAIDAAVAEIGAGFPVGSKLRFPGLEPVYRIVVLLPRTKKVVYVDGISGEVLVARRWQRGIDVAEDAAGEERDDSSL